MHIQNKTIKSDKDWMLLSIIKSIALNGLLIAGCSILVRNCKL